MKYYTFYQNNSGGAWYKDDKLDEYVIIEAKNANKANERATTEMDIYFNGCANGWDCTCCGDRWTEVDEYDGYDVPSIYGGPIDEKTSNYVIHYADGRIEKR
jgi:hypothetical protein